MLIDTDYFSLYSHKVSDLFIDFSSERTIDCYTVTGLFLGCHKDQKLYYSVITGCTYLHTKIINRSVTLYTINYEKTNIINVLMPYWRNCIGTRVKITEW